MTIDIPHRPTNVDPLSTDDIPTETTPPQAIEDQPMENDPDTPRRKKVPLGVRVVAILAAGATAGGAAKYALSPHAGSPATPNEKTRPTVAATAVPGPVETPATQQTQEASQPDSNNPPAWLDLPEDLQKAKVGPSSPLDDRLTAYYDYIGRQRSAQQYLGYADYLDLMTDCPYPFGGYTMTIDGTDGHTY